MRGPNLTNTQELSPEGIFYVCVGGGVMSVGGYHRLPTRYYLTKRSETTSVLPVNTQGQDGEPASPLQPSLL